MFKAKLIENDSYYQLRSKQSLLMLLPILPMGIGVHFRSISPELALLLIGLYILGIILLARNTKRLRNLLGQQSIEMDEEEIRIKSRKNNQEESIKLRDVKKLILKQKYSMPQETVKEIGQELTGRAKQNYLILHLNDQKRRLDFEMDSYYMLKQLEKLIDRWTKKGYDIERIDPT